MLAVGLILQVGQEGPINWYQSMETRSKVAGKRMETMVEELEDKVGLQTELQEVISRLDKLDRPDFEKT